MSDATGIAWTDATWNVVTGCSHVSDGCSNCYAETLSLRHGWSAKPWTAPNAAENVVLHPERLDQPLHWKKPRRVFVNSMSDLFHERVPFSFLLSVWWRMAQTRHTYQILTKRPERMLEFGAWMEARCWEKRWRGERWVDIGAGQFPGGEPRGKLLWPLVNVWLGVSIEQDRWAGRADLLRRMPAARRFVSAEPLLEPLPSLDLAGIDWLIFGGESGHAPDERSLVERWDNHALSIKPWALAEGRRLRDLAHASGASYFLKQWGGPTPKSGGDLLDGAQHHEFPQALPFPIDDWRAAVGG